MDYTVTWGEGPEDVRVETSGPVGSDVLDAMVEEALACPAGSTPAWRRQALSVRPAAREWLSGRL